MLEILFLEIVVKEVFLLLLTQDSFECLGILYGLFGLVVELLLAPTFQRIYLLLFTADVFVLQCSYHQIAHPILFPSFNPLVIFRKSSFDGKVLIRI